MGGGGGGGKRPKIEKPDPIDFEKMYKEANVAAGDTSEAIQQRILANYGGLEKKALGSVDKIASKLDNQNSKDALSIFRKAGDTSGAYSSNANQLEQSLYDSASSDLALGRSLSQEEQAEATQAARGAMQARGLATSNAGIGAEILNRNAYASNREAQRRNFAASTSNLLTQNIAQRRNTQMQAAQGMVSNDPYARALSPGLNLGSNLINSQNNLLGQTYANSLRQAGNAESFNTNMQASQYNSAQNNWAASQSAAMQENAANNQAMVGAGSAAVVGAVSIGFMI